MSYPGSHRSPETPGPPEEEAAPQRPERHQQRHSFTFTTRLWSCLYRWSYSGGRNDQNHFLTGENTSLLIILVTTVYWFNCKLEWVNIPACSVVLHGLWVWQGGAPGQLSQRTLQLGSGNCCVHMVMERDRFECFQWSLWIHEVWAGHPRCTEQMLRDLKDHSH